MHTHAHISHVILQCTADEGSRAETYCHCQSLALSFMLCILLIKVYIIEKGLNSKCIIRVDGYQGIYEVSMMVNKVSMRYLSMRHSQQAVPHR